MADQLIILFDIGITPFQSVRINIRMQNFRLELEGKPVVFLSLVALLHISPFCGIIGSINCFRLCSLRLGMPCVFVGSACAKSGQPQTVTRGSNQTEGEF